MWYDRAKLHLARQDGSVARIRGHGDHIFEPGSGECGLHIVYVILVAPRLGRLHQSEQRRG